MIADIEDRLREAVPAPGNPVRIKSESEGGIEQRSSRVLLLEGDRGVGKTSFMLTLMSRWKGQWDCSDRIKTLYAEAPADRGTRSAVLPSRDAAALCEKLPERPPQVRVLGDRPLDFDPLPQGMSLMAALVQVWNPLASRCETAALEREPDPSGGDTLLDSWHRLFQVAAAGWSDAPISSGLLDQVLNQEERVSDWHNLPDSWKTFVDKLVDEASKLPDQDRITRDTVFVIMIDDCDLQIGRVKELLPALRLLYHPRVFFLVAAHEPHLRDMMSLDCLGRQRRLCDHSSRPLAQLVEDRWPEQLAEASYEKVFPLRNRFKLRSLSLSETLQFPRTSKTIGQYLDDWYNKKPGAGEILKGLGDAARGVLPPLMTYRSAQQLHEIFEDAERRGESLMLAVGQLISPKSNSVNIVEYRGDRHLEDHRSGEVVAMFRGDDGVEDGVVVSARPDFIFKGGPQPVRMSDVAEHGFGGTDFTRLLVTLTLREEGFPILTRLRWNMGLALIWTRARMPDPAHKGAGLQLSFKWPISTHPSPGALVKWAQEWKAVEQYLAAEGGDSITRRDMLVFNWIKFQEHWSNRTTDHDARPDLVPEVSDDDWKNLFARLDDKPWRTDMLPLLGRPELDLVPKLQRRLLDEALPHADVEYLRDQRRRLITDAILAAADEGNASASGAEEEHRVERLVQRFEERYCRNHNVRASPWAELVESSPDKTS